MLGIHLKKDILREIYHIQWRKFRPLGMTIKVIIWVLLLNAKIYIYQIYFCLK